jgi:chitinase
MSRLKWPHMVGICTATIALVLGVTAVPASGAGGATPTDPPRSDPGPPYPGK